MATTRVTNKAIRLFLTNFRQVGTSSDGHPRLEIFFKSSRGLNYVWVPDLRGAASKLFQLACQAKATDQKPIKVENALPKPTTDYMSLAIKIAKSLHQKTSLGHVEKVAKTLFKFDLVPSLHVTMPDVVAQEIFDWIITLGTQPIDENDKIRLVKEFTSYIAPKSSSAEKSAKS